MRWLLAALMLLVAVPVQAQIPSEWEAAAKVVIGDLERDTPQASKPWGDELRRGFTEDPRAVAAAAGLDAEEVDALVAIDRTGLELAARSYAAKRRQGQEKK